MLRLTDHDVDTLAALLQKWGMPRSHAPRLLRAFYQNPSIHFHQSLTLSKTLRFRLERELAPDRSELLARHVSRDGTVKLLLRLSDADGGGAVETVLMPGFRPGVAAGCVSSQVGCAMGCDFCASTRSGLERNLLAGEIVEQFLALRAEAAAMGRTLKTIVFMGMGEPLHNLPNVLDAIRRIADPDMGGLGWRQVTVSTVGIVAGIDALADADLNVHLAVSLHAPDDETRSRIVPVNKRWPVAEVMEAAKRFAARTGRVPNIEYCLLAGVNDSDDQAHLLASLMRGFRAHVNLIPYNTIGTGLSGATYARPSDDRIRRFLTILREAGVVTHVRATRGDEVSAACGQLQGIVIRRRDRAANGALRQTDHTCHDVRV